MTSVYTIIGEIFISIKDVLGNLKYQNLQKVANGVRRLAHGNADVERGFSENNKYFTP